MQNEEKAMDFGGGVISFEEEFELFEESKEVVTGGDDDCEYESDVDATSVMDTDG